MSEVWEPIRPPLAHGGAVTGGHGQVQGCGKRQDRMELQAVRVLQNARVAQRGTWWHREGHREAQRGTWGHRAAS